MLLLHRNNLLILVGALFLGACAASKPLSPFQAAQHYYEKGQETEARRALETELANRPNNLVARYNLAVLLSRIGHDDEAQKLYENNMQRGWHLPSVVNLSVLYTKAGHIHRAELLLMKATKHFRNEAVPWYLLAELAVRSKNYSQARKDFEAAIHADPKNGYAHIRYARFLAAQDELSSALIQSSRAVSLLPDVAECWTIRGDILTRARKFDSALIAYQKSAALKPNWNTRLRIIATLRKLGKNSRANHIEQALRLKESLHQGEK